MLNYERLRDGFSTQVEIVEMDLSDKEFEGLYYKSFNAILIEKELPAEAKVGILLEEWGHYKTTTKNILDKRFVENSKQEQQAVDYGIRNYVSIEKLKEAIRNASSEVTNYEVAEYLNITVEFLGDVVRYYKRKGLLPCNLQ